MLLRLLQKRNYTSTELKTVKTWRKIVLAPTLRFPMKRGIRHLFLFLLLSLSVAAPVQATSWVDLPPEEVISKASIVVEGTYDFSKSRGGSETFWVGYDFKVSKVYRGDVESSLVVGIDGFDVGWADEYQRGNGKFLLFLEQSEQTPFPTPVAGPNGMIQIKDGIVQHHDDNEQEVFQAFIDDGTVHKVSQPPQAPTENAGNMRWIAVPIALILFLFLLITYRSRRPRHD